MTHNRRGRPREQGIDAAVRAAVNELLEEVGYQRCTVDAIAARAGVGKAALYRRWKSKAELVFAAVVHDDAIAAPHDTGTLRGDVASVLADIQSALDGPQVRNALPGLLADLRAEDGPTARLGELFLIRERAYLAEVLDRAIARGELARRPEVPVVHAMLLGSVFAWLHLLREAVPPGGLADALAPGLYGAIIELGR
ncbi:TetR/AcrR family transcriptional regulator [Amycolatopsis echigonensis]|uniref:TetR/AcrR family transcriptional regulator n=1 Tax=Amycolatopsis echigonensis TaxID=2576905 RepID=A0A8E2B4B0_9PSEU|nr:TetR/AcrR family transcriptional regulator [Amycolatopsis echigonensis]MBB2500507.1 TetR/AcrR family transcriptional regulator [Amycolatopsis echigonensis]